MFDVREVCYEDPRDRSQAEFFVVDAPDWVNVVPITERGEVVLIRQFRYGVDDFTLEIPGGMCDPGESPGDAAARELREETGYVAATVEALGRVHPNPAIQSNRCHSYVARGCRRVSDPTPDAHEAFEIVTASVDDVLRHVDEGRITHALVVSALHFLGRADRT